MCECISPITTLDNMKRSVFGFLYYAKETLESEKTYGLMFIPYFHNNSSTFESTFSAFRASGRDTSLAHEKGLIRNNFRPATKLATSVSYSPDHSTLENNNLYSSNFDITEGPKERETD